MSWGQRLKRGARWGTLVGALYFGADLAGEFVAIGSLFDAKWEAFFLLGCAGGMEILFGSLFGMLLGLLWRPRWRVILPRPLVGGGLLLFVIGIAIGGYLMRIGRVAPALGKRPPVTAKRPAPVLLVVVDTLRADSLLGENRDFSLAPALGSYAKDSLVFTDTEAAAGWTVPATATLLTGIHPTSLYSARGFLPDWAPTLAERLYAAGYETRALMDNALLEARNGFADGFESFFQKAALRFAFSKPGFRAIPRVAREALREELQVFYHGAPRVTDEALRILEQQRQAPLFMYVHYMDTHYPYYSHPEVRPDPEDSEPIHLHLAMTWIRDDPTYRPTPSQMRFLHHRYRGEISFLDLSLARLLNAWHQKYGDESLVVITADHGEEFLDHNELGHGHTLYRELVQVPLIMRLPASLQVTPRQVGDGVGHVDLAATVVDALGVSQELGASGISMQGVSWLPWLRGEARAPTRPIYGTSHRYGRRVYRYRQGDWVQLTTAYDDGKPTRRELFDLGADPKEQNDLRSTEPSRDRQLSAAFGPYFRALEAARDPRPVEVEPNIEAMRALGYVQ